MARKIRKSIRGKGKSVSRRRNRTVRRRRKIRGGEGETINNVYFNAYNDDGNSYSLTVGIVYDFNLNRPKLEKVIVSDHSDNEYGSFLTPNGFIEGKYKITEFSNNFFSAIKTD